MGEKGNITADELAATAEAGGLGAVVAGAGTTVTAVFSETSDKLKDKLVDKGLDAGIESGVQRYRDRKAERDAADGDEDGTPPPRGV